MTAKPRLTAIDILRGLAIHGVIIDHLLRCIHLHDLFPRAISVVLNLGFRSCAPVFIVLFGIMLELAYNRSSNTATLGKNSRRLWTRAAQCWIGYACVCMVPVLTLEISAWTGLLSAGGLGASRFADVLKFYALALLLAPVHLYLSARFGWSWLLASLSLAVASFAVVDYLPYPDQSSSGAPLTGLLFGRPVGVSFFSLWHGWVFVAAGAIIGRSAREWRAHGGIKALLRACFLLWLVSSGVVIFILFSQGLEATKAQFSGGANLRTYHPPIYYAAGVAIASALTGAFCAFGAWKPRAFSGWPKIIHRLGQHSLFAFVASSALYAAVPASIADQSTTVRICIGLTLFALTYGLLWWRIARSQKVDPATQAPKNHT